MTVMSQYMHRMAQPYINVDRCQNKKCSSPDQTEMALLQATTELS